MGCGKQVKKTGYSLACTICGLWCHKECAGVTDEVFKLIEAQVKATGVTYWGCRSCTTFAKQFHSKLGEVSKKLTALETRTTKNEEETKSNREEVKNLERRVKELSDVVKRRDEKVVETVREREATIYEEMREREARKLNVIFHGVGECEDERATGKDRQEWDKKSCVNIFRELKLSMTEEAVKFCRRVGEKQEGARPLVVGFFTEMERSKLLRNARGLMDSNKFYDVTIGPDLTKKQRDEEAELRSEADRRNEELTEDDVQKNLHWAVVGARGEKRLQKTVRRTLPGYNREGGR